MCITNSCSLSRSTGEMSATNRAAIPAQNDVRRQPPAPPGPASTRAARQRRTYTISAAASASSTPGFSVHE